MQVKIVFQSHSAERPSLFLQDLAAQIKSGMKITEAHIDRAVERVQREAQRTIKSAQGEIAKADNAIAAAKKKGAELKAKLKTNVKPVPKTPSGNATAVGLTRVGKEGQGRFRYQNLRIVPNAPCTGWLIGTGRREVLYITTQHKSLMKDLNRAMQAAVNDGARTEAEYIRTQMAAIEALVPHIAELKAMRAAIPAAARQRLR